MLDLSPFVPPVESVHYKTSDRYLHELFYPDMSQAWERANAPKLYAEAHSRLSSPIYCITMVCLALAAVLGGSFSRLGYGRRIIIAAAAAAAIRIIGVGVQAVCDDNVWFNLLQYLTPAAPAIWALSIVLARRKRRGARVALALPAGALGAAE